MEDEHNGLLVDFFSPHAIAEQVDRLLQDRALAEQLGAQAHRDAVEHYSLERCLPRQLNRSTWWRQGRSAGEVRGVDPSLRRGPDASGAQAAPTLIA